MGFLILFGVDIISMIFSVGRQEVVLNVKVCILCTKNNHLGKNGVILVYVNGS